MTRPGIIVFNKPTGITSFHVVRMVRRGTGERRVGHAGTLDPLATGVLLVLLGQATRVTEYLMDLPKTYHATIRLGQATDTFDAEGRITAERPVDLTEEQFREVAASFLGEIEQRPPAYSAVKVGGKPAYSMARKGEDVELELRTITVHRIEVTSFSPPFAEIEVDCSRGTYIRTIAHDIGERLGCGAHLAGLVRTRIGPFTLDDAVTEDELKGAFEAGTWQEFLQPIDRGLMALPAITCRLTIELDLRYGRTVILDEEAAAPVPHPADGDEARAYAEDGSLIGILRYDGEIGQWRPRKVFAPEGE
jgi:tRNA pseudouridine55 synthase